MHENTYSPGPNSNTVQSTEGDVIKVPDGWVLLPPGDTALTRRVKAAGDHWIIQVKKGRKTISRGVWTSAATIERIRADLVSERSTDRFAKQKAAALKRREKNQIVYVDDFINAVFSFLDFHSRYAELAQQMARVIANHATPVGSGTVARTQRIPINERAQAAVIAWMRHQTTGYEGMVIPRIKGKRREVRRMLAQRSIELLATYRLGDKIKDNCPLILALNAPLPVK